MKEKFCSIFLALSLLLTLSVPAFAAQPTNFTVLAEQESLDYSSVSLLSQRFATMSDDEFDRTIAELTCNASDFDVLQNNLSSCGIELKAVEKEAYQSNLTRALSDSDAEIVLSAARRAGENYYHLVVGLNFSTYEPYPSSKDGVTIFFDSTKAQYVNYNEGTGFRLRSGQKATEGTLVFNFDDTLLTWWDNGYKELFYGAVYAKPNSSQSVVFGADYAHTYGDQDFNVTGGSISFNFGPVVSGSVTVNFEVTDKESMWQIGVLDAF